MKKYNQGVATPVLISLAALVLIVGTIWLFSGEKVETPAPTSPTTETPAPKAKRSGLLWEFGLSGALMQVLQPDTNYTETFAVNGETTIKVLSDSAAAKPELALPAGVKASDFTITKTVVTDPATGNIATIYRITPNAGGGTGTGDSSWQVIVTNDGEESTTVNVDVSDNDNVDATPSGDEDDEDEENPAEDEDEVDNGTASLSITIIETLDLNVTSPIIGAYVVAIITSPSGNVFTIELTESSPGVYTGIFSNITEVGTYHVTYVISGETSDGTHFDQTVEDTFDVTEEDLAEGDGEDGTPAYQSTKVFDIDQSGEVRPKQTGDY